MKLFWEVSTEQAWTPIFYLKGFDMDSVQVGKALSQLFTSLFTGFTSVGSDLQGQAIPEKSLLLVS